MSVVLQLMFRQFLSLWPHRRVLFFCAFLPRQSALTHTQTTPIFFVVFSCRCALLAIILFTILLFLVRCDCMRFSQVLWVAALLASLGKARRVCEAELIHCAVRCAAQQSAVLRAPLFSSDRLRPSIGDDRTQIAPRSSTSVVGVFFI